MSHFAEDVLQWIVIILGLSVLASLSAVAGLAIAYLTIKVMDPIIEWVINYEYNRKLRK